MSYRYYFREASILKEMLNDIRANDLKKLARKAGLPKELNRKDDLIAAVEKHLEENLPQLLERLSEHERLIAAEAAYHDGAVSQDAYTAKYGEHWPVKMDKWGHWTSKDETLLDLLGQVNWGIYRMADNIVPRVRKILPKPARAKVKSQDNIPAKAVFKIGFHKDKEERPVQVYEGEKLAIAELKRVLQLAAAGKIRVSAKSKRPTAGAVKVIDSALLSPDFEIDPPEEERYLDDKPAGAIRAHSWAVLVQQCEWCKPRGEKLVLTQAGKELVQTSRVEAFADGVEAMIQNDDFDEMNRINHIRGQSGRAKRYMTLPSERKMAICDAIRMWPVGKWLGFEEAYRFLLATRNDFLVINDPFYLYFGEHQYGHLANCPGGVCRQYMRAFLFESLATLGVIDVAYVYPHYLWPELGGGWGVDDLSFCGRYDGLLFMRLNPLGAFCLGVTQSYEAPAPQKTNLFKILPNREIVMMGDREPSVADLSLLQQFATQKGEYIWDLDSQRILDHLEAGGSLEDVSRFLEEHSANEIPGVVSVMLSDIEEKTKAIRSVEGALLIETKDASTAALIAHHPETGKYAQVAGENCLVISEKNHKAFKTAVKKLGFILPNKT